MSFFDRQTVTVEIDEENSVVIRSLTYGERQRCISLAAKGRIDDEGNESLDIDPGRLALEMESGGIVAAERVFLRSQVHRLIRLSATGTGSKALAISLAGKYTTVGGYQNSNGNTTVQLSGTASYLSTVPLFFSFVITNALATLP